MASTDTSRETRSGRLLRVLAPYERFLIVMHDNPDPDVIAAGWAIYCLLSERLGRPASIVGGGAIVRAENRHMVELLHPPIQLVSELTAEPHTASILVDCGPGTTNHLVTRAGIEPVAVIDHHKHEVGARRIPFRDVRIDAAASASIAASYLREQQIDPGMKLATAVLYAIRTETSGSETDHSALDRSIVRWLSAIGDPALLAEIENAPLEPEYFSDLALAMQSTFRYDTTAICFLPRASGPEIVGEVADLLVRCRGIQSVLCAATMGEDLVLSSRTARGGGDAADLLRATVSGLGGCGGHAHRAGGKISGVAPRSKLRSGLIDQLRERWLGVCQVKRQQGTRLIARREIYENL
jgi:nanoRNase/pAp phosphatase (c-di-AMP/oligoRNAs hydrolase)